MNDDEKNLWAHWIEDYRASGLTAVNRWPLDGLSIKQSGAHKHTQGPIII